MMREDDLNVKYIVKDDSFMAIMGIIFAIVSIPIIIVPLIMGYDFRISESILNAWFPLVFIVVNLGYVHFYFKKLIVYRDGTIKYYYYLFLNKTYHLSDIVSYKKTKDPNPDDEHPVGDTYSYDFYNARKACLFSFSVSAKNMELFLQDIGEKKEEIAL